MELLNENPLDEKQCDLCGKYKRIHLFDTYAGNVQHNIKPGREDTCSHCMDNVYKPCLGCNKNFSFRDFGFDADNFKKGKARCSKCFDEYSIKVAENNRLRYEKTYAHKKYFNQPVVDLKTKKVYKTKAAAFTEVFGHRQKEINEANFAKMLRGDIFNSTTVRYIEPELNISEEENEALRIKALEAVNSKTGILNARKEKFLKSFSPLHPQSIEGVKIIPVLVNNIDSKKAQDLWLRMEELRVCLISLTGQDPWHGDAPKVFLERPF